MYRQNGKKWDGDREREIGEHFATATIIAEASPLLAVTIPESTSYKQLPVRFVVVARKRYSQ